ncbi:zinc finger protein 569 isoform X3 [Scophthalmus maximus]|uniref:zinc finger protein 569 isoform X3 n=1 Tax=Scophthalmus maximus TaxID=52904 RepID=UPI001FA92104|nr:zinc finger protein 569 isoform X3 [Scophthalmus maximus]
MDGASAAVITGDEAENNPLRGRGASEHSVGPSAEDTSNDTKQCSIECKDCGLKFTHWEVFKTHLHQHSLEEEEVEEEEEEEEDAQTGDKTYPAAELLPEREDQGEKGDDDMDGAADWCDTSSPSQTEPLDFTQSARVAAIKQKLRKVYACLICGKVYTYLVSFQKHQEQHGTKSSTAKSQSIQNLHKYECPYCGMSFIRRTRLIGHLRVHLSHRPSKAKLPRCDQCNKDFTSIKSWMIHADRHREKPFWCLSCAKGFVDEASLDKHLQSHSLRQHKCDLCSKSFQMSSQLMNHYNSHTGAKPYQCSLCGKNFSHSGNIITHQKKHVRVFVGSSGRPLGIKNALTLKKRVKKKNKAALTSVTEEELLEKKDRVQGNENPSEHNELGDRVNSDDSDCGEPLHNLSGSAGSDLPDQSKSETVPTQARQERDESESRETNGHRDHKYWEWECFECDMGFDDVAKLHLHYIKHATGELPFPQADTEC